MAALDEFAAESNETVVDSVISSVLGTNTRVVVVTGGNRGGRIGRRIGTAAPALIGKRDGTSEPGPRLKPRISSVEGGRR